MLGGLTLYNRPVMLIILRESVVLMSEFIENLSKDTFPPVMVEAFVRWCVWEQARPAIVEVLKLTGVTGLAQEIDETQSYQELERLSETAGNYAQEIGKRTGPLGISSAEAASFLMQKLAHAAQEAEFDPEAVSFFTIQVVSWQGFAETLFTDMKKKIESANQARDRQEEKLAELWQQYGLGSEDNS